MTTEPDKDSQDNLIGLRFLREKQKRKAAEAERDAWREEAISHRRRLGIPVPGTGRRPKLADINQALAPNQTTEAITGFVSDENEDGEDMSSKKDINAQPVVGGRLGPLPATERKAVEPEMPATSKGKGRVDPLGVDAVGQPVDPVGSWNRKGGKR